MSESADSRATFNSRRDHFDLESILPTICERTGEKSGKKSSPRKSKHESSAQAGVASPGK